MSFGTERTTDYHLTEAIITSDRTITGIDIFKNVNAMKIFEHIEKPYLTMVLSFADEENVVQDMDFQGGEKISITLIDGEEVESCIEIKKEFVIEEVAKREKKRSPYSPFSNSLLLQDASSKLGFNPKYTNSLAQQLKDGIGSLGALITYHRSDSNKMKKSEVDSLRQIISNDIGENFLSKEEIIYKEKSKFVQQGHEAVTPTQLQKKPEDVKKELNDDQFKLYDLIWKRTVASQMSQSKNLETSYFIKGEEFLLKSSGSIQIFEGFKKIYNYSEKTDDLQKLPNLKVGDIVNISKIEIKQNHTKPPNRYSEAGLIKKLEEIGIGRPSTYVSIFTKLESNNYISIKNKSLIPSSRGKILSKFLDGFFFKFVDYQFTADLEEQLDEITQSKKDWKNILQAFLKLLNSAVDDVKEKSITEVINKINELSPEILKKKNCPKCDDGELTIKFASSGPFLGCTNYNKDDKNACKYSSAIGDDEDNKDLTGDGKKIGIEPSTGNQIFLKIGRYGRYLEMQRDDDKPKRVSIPKNVSNEEVNLEKSLKYLKLPRFIGIFPETKEDITASIGPYGPYLKHGKKFISLKEDDVAEVGINRAIELIQKNLDEKKEIIIGLHPETKKNIVQKKGIKGRPDYISYNKKNYSVSDDLGKSAITLTRALKIIEERKKTKKK